ncbi:MAG: VIT1/CCC1 transporter family protein [Deltaproteobacteria bacterium]|nr:VIT1/CCC1 transporter family protein [Deltaproteobacteria bacterium]
MALERIEQKKEVIEGRARIREFVFGIQDGLISTVGLLAGVQGATESNAVVILTGLTAMFAGAVSMAAGSYLSSSAEKEIFDKELREAERLAEREPYLAAEGLLRALSEEGLKKEQGYRLVKLLAQEERVFLRTFQEKVFGLGAAQVNRPLQAAAVMGLSFVVGAIVPLLPYFILAGMQALYLSIALASLTLFSVGVFKGYLAARSLFLCGLEFFLIAVGAAFFGYLVGLIVQYFFPGIALPVG